MEGDECTTQSSSDSDLNIILIVLNVFIAVFICSGNILTILTVCKTPRLRTVPNMYVLSLALADLAVGCFSVPAEIFFFIPPLRALQNWSKEFCLFGFITFFMSVTSSILSMGMIAIDRALYIGSPLQYHRLSTISRARIIIIVLWITSIVISSIPAYFNRWRKCSACTAFSVIPMEYQLYIQIPLVMVTCIITAVCYGIIFKIARSKKDVRVNGKIRNMEADLKLVKVFLLVFGLFVICWTPLLTFIGLGHITGLRVKLSIEISLMFPLLNSGMNFFVYVMKNVEFREAILKLISRTFKRRQSNSVQPATSKF